MGISSLRRDLPPALARLRDLALDLRWTWSHGADNLWRTVDPASWQRSENPWSILQDVSRQRLDALAADGDFLRRLEEVDLARRTALEDPGWYRRSHDASALRVVAYFSLEFGLAEALPLYAGGLGVLAGDYLKTASDLGVPVVGIGLLYQEGYFRQMIDERGDQHEVYPYNDPTSLPIEPVLTPGGEWLHVTLNLPGRDLQVRVWRAQVGRVPLYLLDSNDPLNSPLDRGITSKLYPAATDLRILQQIVLGVAGWRVLEALEVPVDICHLNEGHAAFAILERARAAMLRTGHTFREALWETRAGNVFTTHTPVPAAFDRYDGAAVERFQPYLQVYLPELGLTVDEFLALGRTRPDDAAESFTPAYLAIRGSAWVNGVSRLHGEVSRELFRELFPRWPTGEVPVGHVTNGVHVPSWDAPAMDELWERACGKDRWRGDLAFPRDGVGGLSDEDLWIARGAGRQRLIEVARYRLVQQLRYRGADAGTVARAQHALDANALTIGFARRFTEYKRPNLLLRDPSRLERLLVSTTHPVQLIVAGKAHPSDDAGKALIREWIAFAQRPGVRDRFVFLEDYDLTLAQELVRGVDVWLNTPRRRWEACGTSGMKVLANGGLNASVLDGWWAEAFGPEVGWAIESPAGANNGDPDGDDASALYALLEQSVIPAFYARDARGIPLQWLAVVRGSMSQLAPAFSANRMMRQYVDEIYVPAARLFSERRRDGGRLARDLDSWAARLVSDWQAIRLGEISVDGGDGGWTISVAAYLGAIEPADVAVELYAEPVQPGAPPSITPMTAIEALPGAVHGTLFRARVPANRPSSDFTPRVVPRHAGARVPLEVPLIAWPR